MPRPSALSAVVLLAASLATAPGARAQAAADEYVVVLRPGAPGQTIAAAHRATHRFTAVFPGFAARLSPAAVAALRNNPNVERVEAAFTVHAVAETLPTGVDRIDAERGHALGQTGSGVRVAVVDTGIDLDHPDLAARIDAALSRTFVSRGATTIGGDDDQGHGTHVAGTIAAVDNDAQVIGVAPSARLIALKVLNNQGSGSSTDIIAALDYITAHNQAAATYADMIHVANFSLGGTGSDSDTAYRRAFDAAVASGCFVVVAAGNSAVDSATAVPAAYDSVVTVSAMDASTGALASFSNFGADVDIAAPGVDVLSTTIGGGVGSKSGTSMACPHVAGVAALYVGQQGANLTKANAVSTIRAALLGSAEPIVLTGDNDGFREPLIDAEAVLGPGDPPDPAVLVAVRTDKASYTQNDGTAVVTASVTDETAAPLPGLTTSSFTVSGAPVLSFVEVGNGDYAFTVDIAGFAVDVATAVTVAASVGGLSGQATTTITRAALPVLGVSNIAYASTKSALRVSVFVTDQRNLVVPGAAVSVRITRNGALFATGTATTDSTGKATFSYSRPPTGRYVTTVTAVSKAGAVFDPAGDFVDPGFTR
jgi:subtilisin